jgi:hypothetical protein
LTAKTSTVRVRLVVATVEDEQAGRLVGKRALGMKLRRRISAGSMPGPEHATLGRVATHMRAGDAEVIAQEVHKKLPRLGLGLPPFAVNSN